MTTDSIEIARRPEEVFAYIDQLDKHGEWQGAIISTKVETEGPTRVGSRAVDTRKVPGGPRKSSSFAAALTMTSLRCMTLWRFCGKRRETRPR